MQSLHKKFYADNEIHGKLFRRNYGKRKIHHFKLEVHHHMLHHIKNTRYVDQTIRDDKIGTSSEPSIVYNNDSYHLSNIHAFALRRSSTPISNNVDLNYSVEHSDSAISAENQRHFKDCNQHSNHNIPIHSFFEYRQPICQCSPYFGPCAMHQFIILKEFQQKLFQHANYFTFQQYIEQKRLQAYMQFKTT